MADMTITVIAVLLTVLQLADGWMTYQILKRPTGAEDNGIMARLMRRFGAYPTLMVTKGAAIGAAWVLAGAGAEAALGILFVVCTLVAVNNAVEYFGGRHES